MKLLSVRLWTIISAFSVVGSILVNPVDAEEIRQRSQAEELTKALASYSRGSAAELIAQSNLTSIIGIEFKQTAEGLEVILKTAAGGERLVPLIIAEDKDLVVEILDATLGLALRNGVIEFNPAPGIEQVTLRRVDESSVRLTITGKSQSPSAEVLPSEQNLVLKVTPDQTTAQQFEPIQEINIVVTQVGTRVETDPREVPQSIQIIPQNIIENRQNNDIAEALEVIPGVVTAFDSFLFNDVNIRGFAAGYRRNGLNIPFFADPVNTANVERIEVLKGPASVLYGRATFGGTVNVVTKKPTDEPFYKVNAAIGNYATYRGAIDLSGPLNESGNVKYRLTLAGESENSFIDDVDRDRFQISPVILWEIGDSTDITFELDYSNVTAENNFGLPARGTVLDNINGDLDRDRNIGDPEFETREIDTLFVGYDLEHRFNDNWQLRNAFQFVHRASPDQSLFEIELLEDERTLVRNFNETNKFDFDSFLLDTSVVGRFNTGSIKHELLAGIELFRQDTDGDIDFGDASSIDLFAPELDNTILGDVTFSFIFKSRDETLGLYLQDKIELFDSLILLAGIRFDVTSSKFEDLDFGSVDFQQEEEFSPRFGIVYKVIPEASLYASYSRSFIPNFFTFSREQEIFSPQKGNQFEIGAKADINNKLSVNLAYFNLNIDNVPTTDPEDINFQIITGEQKSEGVELFVSGEILPGWNVIGGYTYNDAKITEDTDFEGNRIFNVPENAVSFLTNYEIQKGSLQGLGFGVGIYFVGERQGDLANTFEIPSYTRTDASIFYNRDRFRTALNFRNLFDIDYFENSESDLRVRYGAPFTVVGSISYEF
ncbi:MAG: TonB-dependent siderophore receptor [Cyanobacteria bacterium P01_F01_bin.143]